MPLPAKTFGVGWVCRFGAVPRHQAWRINAVHEILEADIAREIASHETRFVPTDCDECGPIGENREVPIYTERGEGLNKLKNMFERFLNVRATLSDHLAAHHVLIEKMDDL